MSAANVDEEAFPELMNGMSNRLHLEPWAQIAQWLDMPLEHVAARAQSQLRLVPTWSLGHCDKYFHLLQASKPPKRTEHTLRPNWAFSKALSLSLSRRATNKVRLQGPCFEF